jgi:hypothetical protein
MTSPGQVAAPPALVRHILPVVAGGAVTLLLTVVTDNWLRAHDLLPSPDRPVFETGPLLLTAAYRGLFAILGCHMAARLAPAGQPRIRYALALGVVLLAVTAIGASALWGQVPRWYSLSSIALTVPYAIVGGGTAVRAIQRAEGGSRRPEGGGRRSEGGGQKG